MNELPTSINILIFTAMIFIAVLALVIFALTVINQRLRRQIKRLKQQSHDTKKIP